VQRYGLLYRHFSPPAKKVIELVRLMYLYRKAEYTVLTDIRHLYCPISKTFIENL
jgi:hypothetical protein